jgi:hypothetical protein
VYLLLLAMKTIDNRITTMRISMILTSIITSYSLLTWSLDHHKAICDDPANLGWPDDGNGRYTRSLGYYDWYWLNISKRIYLNDIEHLAYVLPCTIVSAFVHPYISSGLLFTYLIGRTLYRDGYLEREGAFN